MYIGKREINALDVRCAHHTKGCQWEGKLVSIEHHASICHYICIPCPQMCGSRIMRKNLPEHTTKLCPNRKYICKHCKTMGTFTVIKNVHDKICVKKRIHCFSDGCHEYIQRGKIDEHINKDCQHKNITCMYDSIGCKVNLKRRDMRAHEQDDEAHLKLAINTVVKLKEEVDTRTLRKGESITFKLTNYQHKKDHNEEYVSPSLYSPSGYHMDLRVHVNGIESGKNTHMSVFINILKGKNDDTLKWPFRGQIYVDLLNQLQNEYHDSITLTYDDHEDFYQERDNNVRSSLGYYCFLLHSHLNQTPNGVFLQDDALYFRISVEDCSDKPWLECTVKPTYPASYDTDII